MTRRTGAVYETGELETILSLVPTAKDIQYLSALLGRSKQAISIVYRIAYGQGPFGSSADIQTKKILKAKRDVGITIGRTKPR